MALEPLRAASGRTAPRVVILGGGFAGLNAARALDGAAVEVVLVDRNNYHLFQPLLYQVATGGLSPADIASPLRHILARQKNARTLLAEVVGIDAQARCVKLADGELDYDVLIVATGAKPSYFGHDAWERAAPGLKDIEDATRIRARLLRALERAEREPDPERRRALLTFVVVGGGPTGVELAGALSELARHTLAGEFRSIDPRTARIVLVEAQACVLSNYPRVLSDKARVSLERLGVEVLTGAFVTDLREEWVRVTQDGREAEIAAGTILWAAGVRASSLGAVLASGAGAELDRQGRVKVRADLALPGRPEILVLGDLAHCSGSGGEPLPGVAPVAMQQGRHAARVVRARLAGREAPPFRYRDRGNLATIGRSAAVAELGRLRVSGFFAWILWLSVHIVFLIGFANKALVLVQWGWSYFTRNRTALLITEREKRAPPA